MLTLSVNGPLNIEYGDWCGVERLCVMNILSATDAENVGKS